MKNNDNVAKQDLGACAFALPNSNHPFPVFHAYYGNMNVPHRTNEAAKKTNASEVMSEVIRAKR